ncbi:MAG: hypothetical protein U0930_12105 [Pirellulales bacterium]
MAQTFEWSTMAHLEMRSAFTQLPEACWANWNVDSANTKSTGIAIDPTGAGNILIVDSKTDLICNTTRVCRFEVASCQPQGDRGGCKQRKRSSHRSGARSCKRLCNTFDREEPENGCSRC